MQNNFIDGAQGTPEAAALVNRVAEEIGKYLAEDIVATRDTHPENYYDGNEGAVYFFVHRLAKRRNGVKMVQTP